MCSLFVRNGTIVTPGGVERADVLAEGEIIAAVGAGLSPTRGARIIDAEGLLVLPGLIDPHVHMRQPGGEHKEDWASGTSAALAGGFTTVLAMPNTSPPVTDRATMAEVLALADERAVCDYGLFLGATEENADEAAGVREAAGLKLYMGSSTGDLLVSGLAGQVAHFAQHPGIVAVHAEDEEAVAHFAAQGIRRPPLCAALAVARALALAEQYNCRLHVCHVSTARELALVRDARARGVAVTCEATPHHLFLADEDEAQLGPLGRMNPPLRTREDVGALWAGLGDVDCVATDHAPHTLEEKQGDAPPSGVPGLETALPLLLTAAHEGRLPLTEIARLMAEGPARVFGLARKGRLAAGYDADLVLVDPQANGGIGERPLLTKCGWSPFEGRPTRGRVERVFVRGREAYDGRVLAEAGYGRQVEIR